MANKLKQIVTAKAELMFPHLTTTETYNGQDTGKYTATLKFTKEDTDKLIEVLQNEWDAALSKGELADKKPKRGTLPNLGFREDKNGEIIFKAKTNATIKTKTGAVLERSVPVYDAKLKPMEAVLVGHGSIVKASLSLNPYFTSSTNYGISLYLDGLQVLDLKEPGSGASASSLGFNQEEGYSAEDEEENVAAGIPFVPEDTNDKEEF